MSKAEISQAWLQNRTLAARQGTWMHWRFEAFLNHVPVEVEGVEFELFTDYLKTLGGLTAYRTEWTIFGDAEWLAGSIDFVAQNAEGELVLVDWKRSKGLSDKYVNRLPGKLFQTQAISPNSAWLQYREGCIMLVIH